MDTEKERFQSDFYDQTTVHPLALAALVVAAILTLTLPRKWALLPLIVLSCFVPQSQRIVLATLDFTFIRLMVGIGLLRIIAYNEFRGFQLKLFDKMMIAWAVAELLLATLSDRRGIPSAFIYFSGEIGTRIGLYFICRMLIRGLPDIWRLTTAFAVIGVPVAIAFIYEHFTAHNIFSIFGGVPVITDLRQGRLRCQGAFAHPILAGCFWASILPSLTAMWTDKSRRVFCIIGAGSAFVIIMMCASSTPVMAVLVCGIGFCAFRVRKHMRKICWAVVALLCVLHLVMNAPVWHLIARVSVVGGSTGWHRYSLIDKFVNHWREWLVMGSGRGTAHWGTGLFDVTNYYIIEGLRGGILLLILFIVVLNIAFRSVGRTVRTLDVELEPGRKKKLMMLTAWAAGVCLAQHCANFIAVTYFGQINVVWCMQLAMIGTLVPLLEPSRRRAAAQAVEADVDADVDTDPEPDDADAGRPAPHEHGPRRPEPRVVPSRPVPSRPVASRPGSSRAASQPADTHPGSNDGPIYSVSPVTTWVDLA